MKKDLIIRDIPKSEVDKIREVLESKAYGKSEYDSIECPQIDCGICRALFPRFEAAGCPCHCYSKSYVLKIAREIVKKGGKIE